MQVPVRVENIDLGSCQESANDALAELIRDCTLRHTVSGARTLTLKITVKPAFRELPGRTIHTPEIDYDIKSSKPGVKGVTTRATVGRDGEAYIETNDVEGNDVPGQTYLNEATG